MVDLGFDTRRFGLVEVQVVKLGRAVLLALVVRNRSSIDTLIVARVLSASLP